MTYEELANAILALPEEQRKRKAILANCSLHSEVRLEIYGFVKYDGIEEDKDFPLLQSNHLRFV
jgi:hypothetical protein